MMKHLLPALFAALALPATAAPKPASLTLWYTRPAQYFEEALPIGNGTSGAMIYGTTGEERISLNDITLWTGEPERAVFAPEAHTYIDSVRAALGREDYPAADRLYRHVQGHYTSDYQPLGTLTIAHHGAAAAAPADYRRALSLDDAVATVSYSLPSGARYEAQYMASAPDSVIAIRLTCSRPELSATVSFSSLLPYVAQAAGSAEVEATGYAAYHSFPHYYGGVDDAHRKQYDPARGIHFCARLRAINCGSGTVAANAKGEIALHGCDSVVLLITTATSFNGPERDPVREGRPYLDIARRRMAQAAAKAWPALRSRHVDDYRRLFSRVRLHLGETAPAVAAQPTDVQLRLYADSAQCNPGLEALYFQYGRYLLISCSRTPGVPATLQGLWNERISPPWSSNYTTNINLEENYWPAETTALGELHEPLLQFIGRLARSGQATARSYYGVAEGWCLGQNSDIWATTNPVGLGKGDPMWACWNMGGAWLSSHIWEHYLFSGDRDALAASWPALRGAAAFCLGWLTERDGHLLTNPCTSPENQFIHPADGFHGSVHYGGAADLAMTRQCLLDAVQAERVLGCDSTFAARARAALARLAPYKTRHRGDLCEWYYDWEDAEPQHRHQSHLYGLYPGRHITPAATPDLAAACARTLQLKGDNSTGWSTGWRVGLWARLGDSAGAYRLYRRLLRYISPDEYTGPDARRGGGTYPNLLDAHSPFQIDGNFGGCAGVAEMLVQSSAEIGSASAPLSPSITLLPALPEAWAAGSVTGLRCRGGITLDLQWAGHRATACTLTARHDTTVKLRAGSDTRTVSLKAGKAKTVKF